MRLLAASLVMLGLAAASVQADGAQCMYRNEIFSAGDVSCQAGAQYRCSAGAWQATGTDCADTTGDEEGLQVNPGRGAPAVPNHGVDQPSAPAVPHN
jgi:hypothetical protein